jgi:hypothetical protein
LYHQKGGSVIFFAIILMTGTIATISPSFMTIGEAQAQPYYNDRMDNDYNSYGPTDYGTDKNTIATNHSMEWIARQTDTNIR